MIAISCLSVYGAHWQYLAKTSEPSMCGGDVALCQLTLTTYCACHGQKTL